MVSLCMIVRDEEDVIGRCLESVEGIFDETVIVDTGSKDKTREVALRYTDRVFDFEWCDDFSAARNFAFDKASGDYLMWLDADDVIEGENRKLLRKEISNLSQTQPDVVMLPYHVMFDENGQPVMTYERERIIRADAGLRFLGRVHEAIPPAGKIIHGKAAVCHRKLHCSDPGRNLRILEKTAENGSLEPRLRYYFARELCAAGRLEEAEKQYLSCARDPSAWLENRVSAWSELAGICEKLGDSDGREKALFRALSLGSPRADLCCELGRMFLERNDFQTARFWYELAPSQYRKISGGFVHADFGGYIPFLQLCVICDRLGDKALASRYNALAAVYHPKSEACRLNREYFAKIGVTEEAVKP